MKIASDRRRPERLNRRIRRMTSFLVALAFAILLYSGIALFVAPSGRVAREVGWNWSGLGKEAWGSLHLVFAALFVAFAIVHLGLNWRPFQSYLVDRASHQLRLTKELGLSVVVVVLLVMATLFGWPPATQLEAATEYFRRDFWAGRSGVDLGPEEHTDELGPGRAGDGRRLKQ